MKYLLPAFILLALSQTACVHNQAGNRNNSSSSSLNLNMSNISDTIAPENFLVPADVMSKFKALPMKTKKKFCSANRRSKNLFYNTKPILKIKGYNSRMDNSKSVIGGESSGKFARSASVMLTSLWALEDDFNKELAFNNLYKWAEADAWGKTRRCYLNGSCGTYWARKDGQDPFPGHDDNQAALYVFHIAYAYHVTFADYYPTDDRHITIKKWINKWVKTRMSVNDGFGNDSGWRIPDIFANARQGKVNKNKIVNLLSFIDKNLLDDGSIKNRTTRGNRSLWYHHASMAEIMIGLEIANSVGIEIPKSLLNKIEKAASIFVAGFKDPHTMHQWAKKKYNSQYAGSGDIIFKDKLWKVTGKSWLYTFMYRFPDSSASKEIAQFLEGGEKRAVQDAYIGFGLGCVYGSLTYNPETAKVVEIKVEPIADEFVETPFQMLKYGNFSSYVVTLADSAKLRLIVDWENEQEIRQVRYRISSDKLDITNESHILGCNKGLVDKEKSRLKGIKLSLGYYADRNECVYQGLSDKTVEKLETMIHSAGSVLSQSKIIPQIVKEYVKIN